MIDTHSHIYSEEFDTDLQDVITRAKDAGVKQIILPNVDSESLSRMLGVEKTYPGLCHAAIGLHPTSVNQHYEQELLLVQTELQRRQYIAVGEIGIDLYWDKAFLPQQLIAFRKQIEWAIAYNLPVIVHVRDSFRETMDALLPYKGTSLTGVFHSFTGTVDNANEILDFGGFKLGINGIVTFKNSGLSDVVRQIDLSHLVLETDSPYLTPVPFRGKRNESAYVNYICNKLAEIYGTSPEEVDRQTTINAMEVFKGLSA